MYNTNFPDRADLPTTGRLVRSAIIAGASAAVILVTIVLPSEYGIDPTRVGSLLGLTPMGEIKVQLAQEAAAQAASPVEQIMPSEVVSAPSSAALVALEQRITALELTIASVREVARAEPAAAIEEAAVAPLEAPVVAEAPAEVLPEWREEISFTLTPGQGTEYKLVMNAGAVAAYEIETEGGVINFDGHGEGDGQSASYEQGRSVSNSAGTIQAPFSGTHGWFFRNRGSADVVVTLRVKGDYQEMRKLI